MPLHYVTAREMLNIIHAAEDGGGWLTANAFAGVSLDRAEPEGMHGLFRDE